MTVERIKERNIVVHMLDDKQRGRVLSVDSKSLMVKVRTTTGDVTLPMGCWQKVNDGEAAQ